jgi:outer membrane immunogenic protein
MATGSAYAQSAESPPPASLTFNWSGPYLGGHLGGGWGNEHDNQSGLFPAPAAAPGGEGGPALPADHFSVSGFVGGVHAGYNYQVNQFVIGGEGDIDFTDIKGSHGFSYLGGTQVGTLKLKSDVQGSIRVRAGYAIDNILLYATTGIAFADGKLSVNGVGTSKTHVGWTIGAGVEYAFTQNWIGRAEVRYTDFSKETYHTSAGPLKSGWDQTTATIGVSYKF